jgi:hypothetical protein
MGGARRPTVRVTHCYDFPDVVIHKDVDRAAGEEPCPRYTGGRCRPLPTPTPPYSEEEAEAVIRQIKLVAFLRGEGEFPADDPHVLPSSSFRPNLPPGRDDA